MSESVHVVVPANIDDPARPSGGNVYDRRLCEELRLDGWTVHEHLAPGAWPTPDQADRDRLAEMLSALTDQSVVLIDGLIASAAGDVTAAARRLRIAVLLHMPLAEVDQDDATVAAVEAAVLGAVAAVITTSDWTRAWILEHHGLDPSRVEVAVPGVDPARPVPGSESGGNLLVVGPVIRPKGHDVLVAALAGLTDLDWHCTCAGAFDLDPAFSGAVRDAARAAGTADRFDWPGPLARRELDALRDRADVIVSPSRREAYGMALVEGLARGIPVIATDVGGHREAVGRAPDGTVPGLLVAPDDVGNLRDALRQWLTDPALRTRLRDSAGLRRPGLAEWSQTARVVASVLAAIRAKPDAAPGGF